MPFPNVNGRWIKDLHVKGKTVKLIEKKKKNYYRLFLWPWSEEGLLKQDHKSTKQVMENW